MKSNLSIDALDSYGPAEVAELPPETLADLQDGIAEASATLKRRREALDAALEKRYGDRQQTARMDQKKDTGLIRVLDGNCTVKVDTPNKKIEWDQKMLAD